MALLDGARCVVVELITGVHHGEVVEEEHVAFGDVDGDSDFLADVVQCIEGFVMEGGNGKEAGRWDGVGRGYQ